MTMPVFDDEVFGQGIADAHHHPAFHLALQPQRIDGTTHIVGSNHAQHLALHPCRVFDFHLGSLRGKGEGKVHIAALPERFGFRRPIFIQRTRLVPFGLHDADHVAQGDGVPIHLGQPFDKADLVRRLVVFFSQGGGNRLRAGAVAACRAALPVT